MAEKNPFAAPRPTIDGGPAARPQYANIELIASGQKLVIYAIAMNVASVALRGAGLMLLFAVGIGALALSLTGVYRLATGLEFSRGVVFVCLFLMVVPLANLVVLLVLNSKATRALKDAGYTVGLFGASKAN